MSKCIKFEVFGRDVIVEGSGAGWDAFYLGADGKRRIAHDILIPRELKEDELCTYIADLCHESASKKYPDVKKIS